MIKSDTIDLTRPILLKDTNADSLSDHVQSKSMKLAEQQIISIKDPYQYDL